MLARLRRAKHRPADREHPEVSSPDPLGAAPAANSVESTPLRRHWRRRRWRRSGNQPPDDEAVTAVEPDAFRDSSRLANNVEKVVATPIESVTNDDDERELTTEVASTAVVGEKDDKFEEMTLEMRDERAQYAKRLLDIAHGLHFGSIAILGVFVVQVCHVSSGF